MKDVKFFDDQAGEDAAETVSRARRIAEAVYPNGVPRGTRWHELKRRLRRVKIHPSSYMSR